MKRRNKEKLSAKKKHKGFDGLIVTVALILLVMILIFAFNKFIMPSLNKAVENTGKEIEELGDWENSIDMGNMPGN